MAYGPVSISGVSKKARERMMYMDGKLVWSVGLEAKSSSSISIPDTVDYIIIRRPGRDDADLQKGVRVMRGCSAKAVIRAGWTNDFSDRAADVSFSLDGKLKISCGNLDLSDSLSIEGYQYT